MQAAVVVEGGFRVNRIDVVGFARIPAVSNCDILEKRNSPEFRST